MSYIALANITLSSAASSVTFSNIPTSVNGVALRDLVLVIDGTASVGINVSIFFNNDNTTSNYPYVRMIGNGSTTSSDTANPTVIGDLQTTRGMIKLSVMDYSATDKHKTLLSRFDNPSSVLGAIALRWANTNAITSLRVRDTANAATFSIGTTFALYAIAG